MWFFFTEKIGMNQIFGIDRYLAFLYPLSCRISYTKSDQNYPANRLSNIHPTDNRYLAGYKSGYVYRYQLYTAEYNIQ